MATIPSLALIPSGYKASKVYSVLPSDGVGDFNFTRDTIATRVNKQGLIETVSSNVPRLNYPLIDGVVSGCPSLLLEPERINNLQRSEEFENAYWVNNGVTRTANEIISPSGLLNADLLTGVSGGFGIVRFSTWTATNKVASCFAKAGATNIFKIANVSASNRYVLFDLSNGTVFEQSSGWTGFIENYGNGWYRCTAISNNETGTFSLGVTAASESVYIWGAQLEAGTYSTSYIPTTTTIATRSAEVSNKTSISDLIGQTQGTIFCEWEHIAETRDRRLLTLRTDNSNAIILTVFSNNTINASITNAGASTITPALTTSVLSDGVHKLALSYDLNSNGVAFYLDGSLIGTRTASSLPSLSEIGLGILGTTTANVLGSGIFEVGIYKTRLSNTELQQLTTL
jgi:hypothetical protein